MPPHRVPLVATLVVVCLLVSAAAANACPGATAPVAANLARAAKATRCLVNAVRAHAGLRRLNDAGSLDRAASGHAYDMVRRDFFDHVSPGGSTPRQRAHSAGYGGVSIGETIAWATDEATPGAIVALWMSSAPHRSVLLRGRFGVIGVGIAPGGPGSGGAGTTLTADLGR